MGEVLYDYYKKAELIGGLSTKVLFAGLTKIASTQAKLMDDSPELLLHFEKCLVRLKSDYNVVGTKDESTKFIKIVNTTEKPELTIHKLRNNIGSVIFSGD